MTADPTLVPEWLAQRARVSPEKHAIVFAGRTLTFADMNALAETVAARLIDEGVVAGDRVALLGGNSLAFAVASFAVPRAGAILVPVNVRLTPPEIAQQLQDCGARLLLADRDLLDRVGSQYGFASLALEDLIASAPAPVTLLPREVDLACLHSIIYTSGTTGVPKGAMLTWGNIFWNAAGSMLNLGLSGDDRWLACMPLFHVGGLSILLRGALYGMTVEIHEGFDPDRVNEALTSGRVTIVSLVATMLQRMLERHDGMFHPNLRCVLLGGGPVPFALVQECLRRGIPVAQTYGLTEAASQVSTLLPSEAAARPGSAGRPLMPVSLRVERDDGSECVPGEPGEILVRGPSVTSGYFGRPKETSQVLRGGWLHTGDFGYLDVEGYLHVVDRREDVIVSGGENVYPAEVESVLSGHPAVREAGVFAVSDATWGQEVRAAVALQGGSEFDEAVLVAYCREHLAGYKVPKRIHVVAELPRNASGKLLRRELRRQAEAG